MSSSSGGPEEPQAKRRKVSSDVIVISDTEDEEDDGFYEYPPNSVPPPTGTPKSESGTALARKLNSLSRAISPPLANPNRGTNTTTTTTTTTIIKKNTSTHTATSTPHRPISGPPNQTRIPSPFTLTTVAVLSPTANHATTTLSSILRPPSTHTLTTIWSFNYLHSIPFLRENIPPASSPEIYIVHGSWRSDDPRRLKLEEEQRNDERIMNSGPAGKEKGKGKVKLVTAYMPEMFGTHHTKMLKNVVGEEMAKVVIHTANMIPFDWGNMTQGVWESGWLPLQIQTQTQTQTQSQSQTQPSSKEFKASLLRYLAAYGSSRTGALTTSLQRFEFGAVRAVFVGSVPGRFKVGECEWGYIGLSKSVSRISSVAKSPAIASSSLFSPAKRGTSEKGGHFIIQISSIATLSQGGGDTWFTPSLITSLFPGPSKPKISIIFPTPREIRNSINGYSSGGAIHLKNKSVAQKRQTEYLRKWFCRWGASREFKSDDGPFGSSDGEEYGDGKNGEGGMRRSGRAAAAPHIKTYIHFYPGDRRIRWALLTSANLSTQAWGAREDERTVKIASYEAGVLVYPELWAEDGEEAEEEVEMRPVFARGGDDEDSGEEAQDRRKKKKVVELRMPYDMPLKRYAKGEEPWSGVNGYRERDWLGGVWEGD
ncbi:tyrosyl-DNA phosphodiesterase-domain-containing protein [Peziza echinospora]|nr:tyrosyl-DNA phosphodiesterase-domain-containing protein [Peziza echinospora]